MLSETQRAASVNVALAIGFTDHSSWCSTRQLAQQAADSLQCRNWNHAIRANDVRTVRQWHCFAVNISKKVSECHSVNSKSSDSESDDFETSDLFGDFAQNIGWWLQQSEFYDDLAQIVGQWFQRSPLTRELQLVAIRRFLIIGTVRLILQQRSDLFALSDLSLRNHQKAVPTFLKRRMSFAQKQNRIPIFSATFQKFPTVKLHCRMVQIRWTRLTQKRQSCQFAQKMHVAISRSNRDKFSVVQNNDIALLFFNVSYFLFFLWGLCRKLSSFGVLMNSCQNLFLPFQTRLKKGCHKASLCFNLNAEHLHFATAEKVVMTQWLPRSSGCWSSQWHEFRFRLQGYALECSFFKIASTSG